MGGVPFRRASSSPVAHRATFRGERALTDERIYHDEEVGEIFARAASADAVGPVVPPVREGFTLAELQDVGREVGIPPERVATAAAEVAARSGDLGRRTSWGAPVSIGRTAELARVPSDDEWNALVKELRGVAGSSGRVITHGEAREWTTGDLHVFIEPSSAGHAGQAGHRVRLMASQPARLEVLSLGSATLVVGLVFLLTSALDVATFGPLLEWLIPAVVALTGAGLLAMRSVGMRRWEVDTRAEMERIIDRTRLLLAAPQGDVDRLDEGAALPQTYDLR